jgi:hypothetical protein
MVVDLEVSGWLWHSINYQNSDVVHCKWSDSKIGAWWNDAVRRGVR